jgi:hypothetical protein
MEVKLIKHGYTMSNSEPICSSTSALDYKPTIIFLSVGTISFIWTKEEILLVKVRAGLHFVLTNTAARATTMF